jgi:hypothetical protein
MELLELFRRLSYGELSNLAIGGEGTGVITEDAKPRIIAYTNEALTRLHSRFLLRENVLMLGQIGHLTYYYLLKRFARSEQPAVIEANTPHAYILDSEAEPFQDDVIKVLGVTDSQGAKLALNDSENALSLFTPQPNLLQIPDPVAGALLAVNYQAKHPELQHAVPDYGCQLIDLPFTLEGALTAYVAFKVFSHMNGQDNSAKAAEHMTIYEAICSEVQDQDLVSQTQTPILTKFDKRGFC